MNDYEPTTEEESWTTREKILVALVVAFILLELSTMWTWCQWFTNCPKS
jgi:hypothetical protein